MGAALQDHWGLVFSSMPEDQEERDAAERFLEHTIVLAEAERQLDEDALQRAAQAATDSCPGPDGLPYSAWRNAPPSMWSTLCEVGHRMSGGGRGSPALGASVTHCIPKAETYEEARRPTRPGGTRPLTMMQTSANILALTANEFLGSVAEQTVASNPRGFVQGRRMETNTLEVGAGLIEGSIVARGRSAAPLLDFAAAFPSLRHRWIVAVLHRMKIPKKMIS